MTHYQDVLGQLPGLKTYTHFLLCFPLPASVSNSEVVQSFKTAVSILLEAFPWLRYNVVHEGQTRANSGTFRLVPCFERIDVDTIVHVQGCKYLLPPYQEIVDAHGPIKMLDGAVLTRLPAFPQSYSAEDLDPAPVLDLQLNFIQGGLLLDFAAQHNAVDGGGALYLLDLLGRTMQGESLTATQLKQGNQDRSRLITLLRTEEHKMDHSHLIREVQSLKAPTSTHRQVEWRFVRLRASAVEELKCRANEDIEAPEEVFVSTNDVISAFVWKSISESRIYGGVAATSLSKCSRAVDARRALGISREYMGQMGYNATCYLTLQELADQSVGCIALQMRKAVQQANTEHAIRSWATLIANEPDKSRIMFGGTFNPDTDVGMSSLIHGSVHNVHFGNLGKPQLIRRPSFVPLQSCVYLWTRTTEGHVDILLCLKDADWDGLDRCRAWKARVAMIG